MERQEMISFFIILIGCLVAAISGLIYAIVQHFRK